MAGDCGGFVSFILLYYTAIQVYIDPHNCPTDARGEVAMALLPVMLPPPFYKQGRKLVQASIGKSKRAFIDVKPVSNLPLNRN